MDRSSGSPPRLRQPAPVPRLHPAFLHRGTWCPSLAQGVCSFSLSSQRPWLLLPRRGGRTYSLNHEENILEPAFCLLPHRQGSLRLVVWHWGCLCSSPAVPGHARGGTDPAAWCGPAPAPPACRALGWRSVTHCEHNQCQTCTQPLPATLPEGETMFIPKNTKHLPPAFVYFFKSGGPGRGGWPGRQAEQTPWHHSKPSCMSVSERGMSSLFWKFDKCGEIQREMLVPQVPICSFRLASV